MDFNLIECVLGFFSILKFISNSLTDIQKMVLLSVYKSPRQHSMPIFVTTSVKESILEEVS